MRPTCLAEIVGQPAIVRRLQRYVANPKPACFLFEGPQGTGKTSTAEAFAADLGCECQFTGLNILPASELTIDEARRLFERDLRLKPLGGKYKVLVIEEMERLASGQLLPFLKHHIQSDKPHFPQHLTIIATANHTTAIDRALLDRFTILPFSGGPTFAQACGDVLGRLWEAETDQPLPSYWLDWGAYQSDGLVLFSMRRALASMQAALDLVSVAA
jgi:replication-associated recombination protein RarA